jgi:DNA-directed RNA polymerase II subunit RPB1
VYTSGTNLIKVLEQPGVDPTRTSSNDIGEVYRLFGIEAARQLLYNQLNVTYCETGAAINFHHLSLLVDLQTYFGQMMPISRHGINRTDNSPITKASFEETLEQLSEAAGYAVSDNMHGISANIAAGQMMPAGTGALFDLVYDAQESGVTEAEVEEIFGGDDEDFE